MWENFGSMSIDWNDSKQQHQDTAAANASATADAHSSIKSDDACAAMCDGVCAAVATFRVHNADGVPVLQTTKSSCTR